MLLIERDSESDLNMRNWLRNFLLIVSLQRSCSGMAALWPNGAQIQSGRKSLVSSLEKYLDLDGLKAQIKPGWKSVLRSLIRSDAIRTLPVLSAMMNTDRADFCCFDDSCDPYDADYPIPMACGATVSEAWLHAICLEHVQSKLGNGARAMDIGTGSGYCARFRCISFLLLIRHIVTCAFLTSGI